MRCLHCAIKLRTGEECSHAKRFDSTEDGKDVNMIECRVCQRRFTAKVYSAGSHRNHCKLQEDPMRFLNESPADQLPPEQSREVVNGNFHVTGNLTVGGSISVMQSREFGDWAESFQVAPNEDIGGCDVVGITSEMTLSLDTAHTKRVGIVSENPSVQAGSLRANGGAWRSLALLGQVRVKFTGPVQIGDFLIPSGRNDGKAARLEDAGFDGSLILGSVLSIEDKLAKVLIGGHPRTAVRRGKLKQGAAQYSTPSMRRTAFCAAILLASATVGVVGAVAITPCATGSCLKCCTDAAPCHERQSGLPP